MKRHTNVAVIATLSLGLLLSMLTSVHAGGKNHAGWKNKELIVCRLEVSLYVPTGRLATTFTIRSTGDIAGNQGILSVHNSRYDAEPSDAEAAATALANLAKSHGCTVGSLESWQEETEQFASVECVCEGSRQRLISVTGDMMGFVLTSPETP